MSDDPEHERFGLRLVETCGACPEQYDVFRGTEKVGYLRLRHGSFTAECTLADYGDDLVYKAHPHGDGIFEPNERDQHLNHAVFAIIQKLTSLNR